MKRYGLYNHPQARIIGEMVEVEFGTWVRYEDVAAIEAKYSEAVEFITGLSEPEQCPDSCKCENYDTRAATDDKIFCEQRSICLDCISEKAIALLKRHKGE